MLTIYLYISLKTITFHDEFKKYKNKKYINIIILICNNIFLEPGTDDDNCTTSGSDTSIQYGTYNVVPSTFNG